MVKRIPPPASRRSTHLPTRALKSVSSRSRNNSVLRSATTASMGTPLVCHRQSALLNIGLAGFHVSSLSVGVAGAQPKHKPAQNNRSHRERCVADQPKPSQRIHASCLKKLGGSRIPGSVLHGRPRLQ